MTVALPEKVEVAQSARMPGGILTNSLPAPEGWQRGLSIPFYGCGEPIVRDKCISGEDTPIAGGVATFRIFPIEQGAVASTMCDIDVEEQANGRLDQTSEWAVGRQLAENLAGIDTPSLADATLLGTVADGDFATAVGCLEQAAADNGFGARWTLHTPVRGAAYLRESKMLNNDFFSPAGAQWIVSPGYPVEGPTTIRLWVTGSVWAAVGMIESTDVPDWRKNDQMAWALRAGIVAFDPCLNFAIDVTVPACPVPPGS